MSNVIYRIYAEHLGNSNVQTFIGNSGELFYNPASGALRISDGSTLGGNPIAIESAVEVYDEDLLPSIDNTYSLGSNSLRWKSMYLGPGSLYLQDTNNAGLNAEITVTDGVLQINGADQLTIGLLTLANNSIVTVLPETDITIGSGSDTGDLVSYRSFKIKDGNDNDMISINTDGTLVFGGTHTLSITNGLFINGIRSATNSTLLYSSMMYDSANNEVTYGNLDYAQLSGYPRMPSHATDDQANTSIRATNAGLTPGVMYFNTTDKKIHIWTTTTWHALN
jgi:hypothetical protein